MSELRSKYLFYDKLFGLVLMCNLTLYVSWRALAGCSAARPVNPGEEKRLSGKHIAPFGLTKCLTEVIHTIHFGAFKRHPFRPVDQFWVSVTGEIKGTR